MRSGVAKSIARRLLLSSIAWSAACSSTSGDANGEPGHGDASTTGDGTGADITGGSTADGDEGRPPPQASLSIHVTEYDSTDPMHTMDRCPPSRHWVNVPYQRDRGPTTQTQQTSAEAAPSRAVDNQAGDSVSCSVKPNGSGFAVKADAAGYAESFGSKVQPSIVHIRINSIGPGDSSAAGSLTIQDHLTFVTYASDQCTFSTIGGSLGVDVGRIWAAVKCENLIDATTPGAVCQLDTGVFVFENCTQ